MRLNMIAALYMGFALTANTAWADQAALEALRGESMAKLAFSEAVVVPDVAFVDRDGAEHHLSEYRGKIVLVNFWATWCAPCRVEMPSLDALQGAMGGEDFVVVPIATGRNEMAGIDRFFADVGIKNLDLRLDPKMQLAHQMGVMALPVTVILNRDGAEIARLMGDADWSSPEAMAIVQALIARK